LSLQRAVDFISNASPDERVKDWPDDRYYEEFRRRLDQSACAQLQQGTLIEKSLVPVGSFVAEPMRYGSLFLAGDAAHVVPPTFRGG